MIALPWKTFAKVDQRRNYVVFLSGFPLKSYVVIPRFLCFGWEVGRQLKSARGLVGYSLLVRPLRGEFWTLSMWQSQKTLLNNFVRREPLSRVVAALQPEVGPPRLFRWTIQGAACPPSWDEALALATSRPRGELLELPDLHRSVPSIPVLANPRPTERVLPGRQSPVSPRGDLASV